MTTVLVNGACGRMGRTVVKAVLDDKELQLVGAVDVRGGADTGALAGYAENGILVETDLAAALERLKPEVMIDFTRPDVVFGNVRTALGHHVSPVVGTTATPAPSARRSASTVDSGSRSLESRQVPSKSIASKRNGGNSLFGHNGLLYRRPAKLKTP